MPAKPVDLKPEYMYRVYRLAIVSRNGTSFDFESWMDNSSWNYLPRGVSIMEADRDVGIQDATDFQKLPEDNGITEVDDVDLSETLGGGGSVANVRAVVFGPNGQLKGDGRFVTLGRAVYDGNRWRIDEPATHPRNISSADQITLEINRFTGSIYYLTVDKY